ncbi:hypothetical protein [Kitasatospora sp. NPDC001547]
MRWRPTVPEFRSSQRDAHLRSADFFDVEVDVEAVLESASDAG